ncbi:hypothetical protein AMES_7048 [Amycolatopsis mediterranei S699]|uniref:MftR C-terminal domain-containing protein n=2 Tax=Amycolatopsis mediterranei TaxID=33910 RepID=A0A0H3DGW1_AMYMU|nr:hypothetical protein [Amycolatopsis mediterranei]ADJ48874.1 conserved hypothetical protein [Amycolatopsis mediterranei U32]AEK45822.1 hypothetical protein RAM_36765 [Amycolatopsis mediterranei S699]AFO80582.1 hypothetical protein AMES_7048 [Amycolatopsis mediterranei S699]AGT87710.1 hypothetical protein B737_7048 [Amycolatopsis mediterranei RB]KDU94009.1 hypothetical protein DV36_01315 [Amycolatopsis mediterranei]
MNHDSVSGLQWKAFDQEVETMRELLAGLPGELPVLEAVRRAVLGANQYRVGDLAELRMRVSLLAGPVPGLANDDALHYGAWERAVSAYVGRRSGQPADSLYPITVGRVVLAVCCAAYEYWARRADGDLSGYLDAALRSLATGFGYVH